MARGQVAGCKAPGRPRSWPFLHTGCKRKAPIDGKRGGMERAYHLHLYPSAGDPVSRAAAERAAAACAGKSRQPAGRLPVKCCGRPLSSNCRHLFRPPRAVQGCEHTPLWWPLAMASPLGHYVAGKKVTSSVSLFPAPLHIVPTQPYARVKATIPGPRSHCKTVPPGHGLIPIKMSPG